jgi:hypothetical protein
VVGTVEKPQLLNILELREQLMAPLADKVKVGTVASNSLEGAGCRLSWPFLFLYQEELEAVDC